MNFCSAAIEGGNAPLRVKNSLTVHWPARQLYPQ
jgi:hypothetical protein